VGKNVDIVSTDPYRFPFDRALFDIVISGSTMEHVQAIWLWVPELVRMLKPRGLLAIITHTQFVYHPHPVDCWRIMPDGMRYLFDLTGQLENYEIEMYSKNDISGVARKRVMA
jgi:ubiquinone/menaquinone biosynthesis C-methylase UbiE